ncbi:hypothetical protein [Niabella aurantiaca]|nr:hypothetical protein [Niabella aurantiaca]
MRRPCSLHRKKESAAATRGVDKQKIAEKMQRTAAAEAAIPAGKKIGG